MVAPRATRAHTWGWAAFAVCAAVLPFLRGFTNTRVFYIRDLSLYFWGRYLWLRREWLSGEWPLWDPYVGAGQPAVSDALHQMFLLPAIAARLTGGEVLGFNLWVALPFPVAALGAWIFFARRFSGPAAALGAAAFALCGPIVSTGNFPNLSWAAAMLPWVLWATDSLATAPGARRCGVLAVTVALQSFAGEPVTQFATVALAGAFALAVRPDDERRGWRLAARRAAGVAGGVALGAALAAAQLIPMIQAAAMAERSQAVAQDFWSLRPAALLETVWLHLFGNYFQTQSLADAPWMPLMFTGREPFFFSIYFGTPLLALAIFGLAGTGPRRWRLFWAAAGIVSVILAFGAYTPIYPVLREYVPLLGSFRFPVKYLVVTAMAVAAGAAAGWDALARAEGPTPERRLMRGRMPGISFAIAVACTAGAAALACLALPAQSGALLGASARALGAQDGAPAAEFMLRTLPPGAVPVVVRALWAAGLLLLATRLSHATNTITLVARHALYALIAGDLLVRAWGINPVLDPAHVAEPAWIAHTRADPDARFYVGGKKGGTLDAQDVDAARGFLNAPGLTGSASRAALSIQAAHYPSGWRAREMLSYDLAVLWPRIFTRASERFMMGTREERDRFLDRTGVRYRILPARHAAGRAPLAPIPYFLDAFLFDWGPDVAPRISIVGGAAIVPDMNQQVDALFRDGWDSRAVVLVDRALAPGGTGGPPVAPYARIVEDRADRMVVEAGAPTADAYLVLLDSYADDWRVRVDGAEVAMARANGLFRAVRLRPGPHRIEFTYTPRGFAWGSAISAGALVVAVPMLAWRRRRAAVIS